MPSYRQRARDCNQLWATWFSLAWAGLAAALWGGKYVVSVLAFEDGVPPVSLSFIRLAIGAASLVCAMHRLPHLGDSKLAALGLVLASTLLTQSVGTFLSGAAAGSLITLLTPVFVASLAPLILREQAQRLQWVGMGLGLIGAATAVGWEAGNNVIGDVLLLLASLLWALFTVAGATAVRERGALEVVTAASIWAVLPMLIAATIELGPLHHPFQLSSRAVLELVYLGLGATALGWWAWYHGVRRAPAAVAATAFLVQPVVGVGLSVPILHQTLSPTLVLGSLLVASGMVVATLGRAQLARRERQTSAPETSSGLL